MKKRKTSYDYGTYIMCELCRRAFFNVGYSICNTCSSDLENYIYKDGKFHKKKNQQQQSSTSYSTQAVPENKRKKKNNYSSNSNPPPAMVIQSIKQGNISSASALRVNQLSRSRSQPPCRVSKLRTAVTPSRSVNSENGENSRSNPNFPDDIAVKGSVPAPPPQSQKPVFKSTETDYAVRHPTVKRSASQTNLQRPCLTRPPPSEKSPPPPKSNHAPPQNAPTPPPSKPSNILKRQSFGVGESHSSHFASNKLSVANNATLKPSYSTKAIGSPPPPPPPRHNSAPNDFNQMVTSSSPSNQCVKMNITPPPPPNRAVATSMRAAPVRPPPPRAPAPPPPPPPPQHQKPLHPAPSQMKAVPVSNLAPPPPAEISSIKQSTSAFKQEEFHVKFLPILEKMSLKIAEISVDTKLSEKYSKIIDHPLQTVKENMEKNRYQHPWQFLEAIWTIFENSSSSFNKKTKIYRHFSKVAKDFEEAIDHAMKSLGYCCGRKYVFEPQFLCCYGKQICTIPRDRKYWSYKDRHYCLQCFSEILDDTVTFVDNNTQLPIIVKKSQFVKMKNDQRKKEPFVDCLECGRKLHKICVLHFENIWRKGFTCDNCLKAKGQEREVNKFTAKRFPETNLGKFLENRVNTFLRNTESSKEVWIRVLSTFEKCVSIKQKMKARYVDMGQSLPEFPYRTKAIFAFQEIDGAEVCFFGMHVEEYDSECPMPNSRSVNIAYLDSVHFFRPKEHKTAVYHEILLGYLEYVKQLGYTKVHIWSYPPNEGDEYIFHCHPTEQKIPNSKRLQEWYETLFKKAVENKVILCYKDILTQVTDDNCTNIYELPYLEEGFFSALLEETLSTFEDCVFLIKKYKNAVFCITLQAGAAVIRDPDPLISCQIMDGRHPFLTLAMNNNYEFSSLRRAKYSTMALLYHVHDDLSKVSGSV